MLEQNIFLTLAELAISAGIVVICRYLIPWVMTKMKKEDVDFVTTWVEQAVKAAEQTHGSGEGKAKKEEVLAFLSEILAKHHISLSAAEIDILIEAAVKQLKIELLYAE